MSRLLYIYINIKYTLYKRGCCIFTTPVAVLQQVTGTLSRAKRGHLQRPAGAAYRERSERVAFLQHTICSMPSAARPLDITRPQGDCGRNATVKD